MSDKRPLVVDLDGTLIRSDLLAESYLALVRQQPLRALQPFLWLRKGRASMKTRLALASDIDVSTLPYEDAVLARLRAAREAGRETVLATASHEVLAQRVARHLGLFDEVMASDAATNLKAGRKRQALVERYGEQGFDYAGNSHADLPVWEASEEAIAVNPDPGVYRKLKALPRASELIGPAAPARGLALAAMRPHQWLKNLLLFVPLLASHRWDEPALLLQGLIAFVCFSLCASSIYLVNDLLDLPEDRAHHSKRFRPLASGRLPIWTGVAMVPLGLLSAFTIAALFLPRQFSGVLGCYLALTLAYSLWAKRQGMLDVIVLAGLYTLRIIAGAAAMGLATTPWMLAFSGAIFLSLALVKRYAELEDMASRGAGPEIPGRGYRVDDRSLVATLGAAAGYIAVLVFVLYLQDPDTSALYAQPGWLWGASVVLLYWISRTWQLTRRGDMHEDPVVFAATDRVSLFCGALLALFMWLAA